MRLSLPLLLLVGTGILLAQEAKPESYAGFEGKQVSRVQISVGVGAHTDAFSSMIKQKENAAFSEQAVRETVAALRWAARYTRRYLRGRR